MMAQNSKTKTDTWLFEMFASSKTSSDGKTLVPIFPPLYESFDVLCNLTSLAEAKSPQQKALKTDWKSLSSGFEAYKAGFTYKRFQEREAARKAQKKALENEDVFVRYLRTQLSYAKAGFAAGVGSALLMRGRRATVLFGAGMGLLGALSVPAAAIGYEYAMDATPF